MLTGKPFKSSSETLTDEQKKEQFISYVGDLSDEQKADLYISINSIMPDEEVTNKANEIVDFISSYLSVEYQKQFLATILASQSGVSKDEILYALDYMTDEQLKATIVEMCKGIITNLEKQKVGLLLKVQYSTQEIANKLETEMSSYTLAEFVQYYDTLLEFAETSYEDNMKKFGCLDLTTPTTINIYASSFENKDLIVAAIDSYNQGVDDSKQIKYTDYMGIMMSSINTIIDAITYVLIAFVAISLVVSSIMIGVITLISVQERTKEIGILRSIGASKSDVSSMFNAETIIIGLASGLLGVIVTYLLCIPINLILHLLTGINTLNAVLPFGAAVILVAISMLLTLVAGIIPSRSAAKKDPVVALRTE